jgi:hypothetical protein
MRDYNFFSQYIYTTKKKSSKSFLAPIVLVLVIAAVGVTWYILNQKQDKLQDEYDANQVILESKEYKDTMAEVEALRAQLEYIRGVSAETFLFSLIMQNDYKVTDDLMYVILLATPQNVAYSNYVINESTISISADTTDYSYIAEFEANLRSIGIFEGIVVTNIDLSELVEDGFRFDVELRFGGDELD